MFKKYFTLPYFTLFTALGLSSVAAWFAIAGLVAIFPAKASAIILMGAFIEVAKIVATVWLRKYWTVASWPFKALMIPMIVIAMLLTSMGTFGFLSSAHSEQSTASGDVAAQVAIIDEKIKTQRDNIELARKALAQMDAQVDARLTRGDSENSAERAVTIRRQQASERAKLQKEISDAQAVIAKLNDERAPIASQLRKVEAEVGPVKYIAALIYGDNPDANTLERAVRWVIIMLVLVFDPFAIALVLAGNASKNWRDPDDNIVSTTETDISTDIPELPKDPERESRILAAENSTPWPTMWNTTSEDNESKSSDDFDLSKYPYLFRGGFGFKDNKPMVYRPESATAPETGDPTINCYNCGTVLETAPGIGPFCPNTECHVSDAPYGNVMNDVSTEPIAIPTVTEDPVLPQLKLVADNQEATQVGTGFGTTFPQSPDRGDVFVRVDLLPNKVFKWDGSRWIEINKTSTDTYMYNESYIQYLIAKLDSGEYEVELLTENEKDQIRAYLREINSKNNILGDNLGQ